MVQRIVEWAVVLVFSAMLGLVVAGLGELKRQTEIIQLQQIALQEYEELTKECALANQTLTQGLFKCILESRGKNDYQF